VQIVLVEPQIPQNTGSIARTCAATNTPLHIVGSTPFEISDRTAKRAGLDYWPYVEVTLHKTWEEYLAANNPQQLWFFSKFGSNPYTEAKYDLNDALVFGSETKGLGKEFLSKASAESILYIPMENPNVRSLNLSNAASIALYEALRQVKSFSKASAR
jgi:tRNA (cytidine/uridine-2'-O-)-methyltransferase